MGLAKDIEAAAVAAAREHGIEQAALLAVVEIESAGKPLEADGVTPRCSHRAAFEPSWRSWSRRPAPCVDT